MLYLEVNLTYPPESVPPIFRYSFEILHGVLSYQEKRLYPLTNFLYPPQKKIKIPPIQHPLGYIWGGQLYFSP